MDDEEQHHDPEGDGELTGRPQPPGEHGTPSTTSHARTIGQAAYTFQSRDAAIRRAPQANPPPPARYAPSTRETV
ncbi:hypothetical protein GCM10009574_061040 [Streptomyces asiaticus]|uniref:Uncharacterized protein n=2 Tax=Streptomyces rhizosphaericus TaxID=114699 RepID=A0ABN1PYS5_9ACTN